MPHILKVCIKFYNTENGRFFIDRALLVLPLIGELLRKVAVAKFTRTLAAMLHSGVPILEALRVVAKTANNKLIERAIHRVGDAVAEGRTIAEPLEESGVFPNMVVQMISVGESVGALDSMLDKIADFYDEEVDQTVANITSAIEPLMMVVLGGLIGGVVIAMYLPVFQLASIV
jgi:type IV pilus assembly protein PilC